MTNKEYTYDIGKYTIGVDENGEDGIGLTVAIIKNGGINFLGNYYGENARCIDLLIKENQKLKEKVDKYENPEDMTLMMMWCTEKVKDENKKLNEALEVKSYCKYANKCDEFNDCSREEYEDMANANMKLSIENCDLKDENQKLNKQLEEALKNYEKEAYIVNKQTRQLTDEYENTKCQSDNVKSLLNQQKEFIKYLEDEIETTNKIESHLYHNGIPKYFELGIVKGERNATKEILQKYKEIIGVSDENKEE